MKGFAKSHDVLDLVVQTPKLQWLVVRTVAGLVTIRGHFIDIEGRIVGNASYTGTIDTTPRTLGNSSAGARVLTDLAAIPANAVGFRGYVSGGFAYAWGAGDDSSIPTALNTDMTDNVSRYPVMSAGGEDTNFSLGRA